MMNSGFRIFVRQWFLISFLLLNVQLAQASLDFNAVCLQPGMNSPIQECNALVNLYNITDGDNWINNNNWGTADVNSWYGITAYGPVQKKVWFLDLASNNLEGIIPGNLKNLTELARLFLITIM